MKKVVLTAAVTAVASLGALSATAQEQRPKVAPVDFRACNFRDGKGMEDLDKVAEKFRAYANENDFDYAAWTLVPQYQTGVTYDIGWLGSWRSNGAFGVSMEKWVSSSNGLAEEFDAVIDCSARHELAMWVPVTAFDATPEEGVLMISQCTLEEGKTSKEALDAHVQFGNHMRGLGSMGQSWLFYPALGTGNIDFDYYHAVAFYRYSDMGAAMELYTNGGGYQYAEEVLFPVAQCTEPFVFDAHSVRAFDER